LRPRRLIICAFDDSILPSVRAGLAFSGEADPPLRLPWPSGEVDPLKSKELITF
jgi:hypothetical protein